ncbi:hypothetical protein UPYG_G00024230 [Umbra pygmaea]|uniref:Uncharacterized protein n=1 Tax=Umbra pygmaea TaxID=75934 RepID=A0ABD0Y5G7_UMBPY
MFSFGVSESTPRPWAPSSNPLLQRECPGVQLASQPSLLGDIHHQQGPVDKRIIQRGRKDRWNGVTSGH